MSFDQFSLFDAFDAFGTQEEVKEEVKETTVVAPAASEEKEVAETKAAVNVTEGGVSFEDFSAFSSDDEEDDGEDAVTDSDEEAAKDSKKSKSTSKKSASTKAKKVTGPVTIVGNGWSVQLGDAGKEYAPDALLKELYEMGYKEVAIVSKKHTDKKIFLNVIDQKSSNDNFHIGDELTIELGSVRATYTPADFEGLGAKEVSLFDASIKFAQDHPEFAGCGLVFNPAAKVACPTFNTKATIEDGATYNVWYDTGIVQMLGADIKDKDVYVSDNGTCFIVEKAPKSASDIHFLALGLDDKVKATQIEEQYRLPFVLWVETFGTRKKCEASDFGGKEVVTKDEVIRYLGNVYRIFRSTTRKFSISYDRSTSTLGVAVISGEKGAAIAAPSLSSNIVSFFEARERLLSAKERVEKTALGLFKGYEDDSDMISLDSFEMALPKIPGHFLDTIIKEFRRDLTKENMVQIYYSVKSKSYYLVKPKATYNKVSVSYQMEHTNDILVISVHSHNTMPAIFSRTDDEDEVYTGLFGVIGDLDKTTISMSFRAGMEGKFKPVYFPDIFTVTGGDIA